ncbi:phosphoribosylaminoimidazolesuccinocarboxamide synthase [Helicobacter aurati]|uniref:phosphoribosylaminoimidazolesuccinocarboxamide synthase n=1 Tax=Helicobacter aurati TaxID=137778 RepID=UPI0039893BE1
MHNENLLYEGKGKKLYKIQPDLLKQIQQNILTEHNTKEEILLCVFKDDLTAFNAQKTSSEKGKGELNCKISTKIFHLLEEEHICTHYLFVRPNILAYLPNNIMFCKKINIIPLEVVTRNITTGSLVKRLGIQEKITIKDTPLKEPLVEFYYKNDSLNDPIVTESHCLLMNLATIQEIDSLKNMALKINSLLSKYFERANLILVDFKLEFGKDTNNKILLADEISPDNCRLWDKATGKKMDKDIFREDIGNLHSAYHEVLQRLLDNN